MAKEAVNLEIQHSARQPGLIRRLARPAGKVAALKASRVGDFICATPALRALSRALPEAEFSLITLPMLREMAERLPFVDRVLEFPGYPGIAEQFFEPVKTREFFERMQAERFDLAVQLQGSGVNANPFTLMLGARYTAGFIRPQDSPGRLDAALPLPEAGHEIDRMLALAAFLGAETQDRRAEFPLRDEDHRAAERLLSEARPPLIGLHPAARDLTRRWSLKNYASAGRSLRRQMGGTLVLVGEAGERARAAELLERLEGPAVNLVGRTSLPVLGAVLSRLHILLTNDTGPAHIAYTVGTPTVTVFGGGDIERYRAPQPGPFRTIAKPVGCRPCHLHECPIGYVCLESVTVPEVVSAALGLLARTQR